jgi:hypothetical protein
MSLAPPLTPKPTPPPSDDEVDLEEGDFGDDKGEAAVLTNLEHTTILAFFKMSQQQQECEHGVNLEVENNALLPRAAESSRVFATWRWPLRSS